MRNSQNKNKMPVRRTIVAVAATAGAAGLVGCSTEAAPAPSTVTATVTVEKTVTPNTLETTTPSSEVVLPESTKQEINNYGRQAAGNIMTYLQGESGHGRWYAWEEKNMQVLGNKSWNVDHDESEWVPEGFASMSVGEDGKYSLGIRILHGSDAASTSSGGHTFNSLNVEAMPNDAIQAQLKQKALSPEGIGPSDYAAIIADSETSFATGLTINEFSANEIKASTSAITPENYSTALPDFYQNLVTVQSKLQLT